ncbi:hypothetical protein HD806DRAFT_516039 [Xylariaceae sp. AK1471]|nr:hypothetical protein HD806DRAFT_516039 [Xylariaceae sp. AK1471]
MTRLQKRLKERDEKIGWIPRAKYDITAQENAEFLQLLLRHIRQWLKHFKADLLDSKIFLSKPCEFSEKEKFSWRHVTDGPLVLFQIMKDMQAYKRQWEEMSFNNLDPDELPPPAFTTEKLVDLIKKCPVVQRVPGRFNKRGEFVRPAPCTDLGAKLDTVAENIVKRFFTAVVSSIRDFPWHYLVLIRRFAS